MARLLWCLETRTIAQRELGNDDAEVIDAVSAGETSVLAQRRARHGAAADPRPRGGRAGDRGWPGRRGGGDPCRGCPSTRPGADRLAPAVAQVHHSASLVGRLLLALADRHRGDHEVHHATSATTWSPGPGTRWPAWRGPCGTTAWTRHVAPRVRLGA